MAFLVDALRRAGLREVRAVPVAARPSVVNVEGVLPGETDREIILSGHYDTVSKSPGAGDDASGCGLAIATAEDLARTPLRHTIRVVLFDGEEKGLYGSRGWVEALSPEARDRILANVNLEMVGWPGSTGSTVHAIPVSLKLGEDRGERVTTPGWLVDAALDGGRAAGWPLHVGDPRWPLPMQLLLRGTRVLFGADSGAFLEQGIPAVTLSDSSFFALDPAFHRPVDTIDRLDRGRLEAWTRAVAAMVRRLDGLDGRPAPEDEYLVLAGRVWSRWALAGIGLALAALLVVRYRVPRAWPFPVLLAAACPDRADPGPPAPRAGGGPGARAAGTARWFSKRLARPLDCPRAAAAPAVSPAAGRSLGRPALGLEIRLPGELDRGGAGRRGARGLGPHAASTCRSRRTARPARVLTVPRGMPVAWAISRWLISR